MGSLHYEETHMWDHYTMKKLTCGIITLRRNSYVGSLHYEETHMWDRVKVLKRWWQAVTVVDLGKHNATDGNTFYQRIQQNFNHQIFDQQICNTFPKNKYLNSPDCKGQHCSYPQYTLFPKGLFSPMIDHQ